MPTAEENEKIDLLNEEIRRLKKLLMIAVGNAPSVQSKRLMAILEGSVGGTHCACRFNGEELLTNQCNLHKAWMEALEFYANPETYYAIGFFPDSPNGPFMDDFSETDLGTKPGKRAREALEA